MLKRHNITTSQLSTKGVCLPPNEEVHLVEEEEEGPSFICPYVSMFASKCGCETERFEIVKMPLSKGRHLKTNVK